MSDMGRLIALFVAHAPDPASLEELDRLVREKARWPKAHGIHSNIRSKTVAAERRDDAAAAAQYWFEEACAKTIYNLTNSSAPFDPDSPYWVVPRALRLARALGLNRDLVLAIVDPEADRSAG